MREISLFSVCIPNYNYEAYLGRTISTVLDQDFSAFELLIADNCSSDGSLAVARNFEDPRIKIKVNACNVGFAGNLDKAASMATGECMLMLSSDDLMRPGALSTYVDLFSDQGSSKLVVSAAVDKIDADDALIGGIGPDADLWKPEDKDEALSARIGATVYRVEAGTLLARCIRSSKNPFNFLATAFPRELYEAVEGYGGSRMINPDKWFHWRLLGVADQAIFIDKPLFAYRWHDANQTAIQASAGALKYLSDEYATTLQIEPALLERAACSRDEAIDAFVENSIGRHGLATLAAGNRIKARQILNFGRAVYPRQVRRNGKVLALSVLLAMGPVGGIIASRLATLRRGRDSNSS